MTGSHASEYTGDLTELCERGLVTLIGHAGFWGDHLYLVGGLVPRYMVPSDGPLVPHVGSRDVDLAIVLAVTDGGPDYETLVRNLRDHQFVQVEPGFRWTREVAGQTIIVEFLGEDPDAEPGKMFRPKSNTGKDFQALNIPGVRLLPYDHRTVTIEANRLDDGARTRVTFRMANLLPFVTLKILAYLKRQKRKDVYDLLYVLMGFPGGPEAAGAALAASPVADDPLCIEALGLMAARFASPDNDAPVDYATFLTVSDDVEVRARYRNEAVAVIDATMRGYYAAQTRSLGDR